MLAMLVTMSLSLDPYRRVHHPLPANPVVGSAADESIGALVVIAMLGWARTPESLLAGADIGAIVGATHEST